MEPRCGLDFFGVERIVFASDRPFECLASDAAALFVVNAEIIDPVTDMAGRTREDGPDHGRRQLRVVRLD